MFDIKTNLWTWLHGTSMGDSSSVYAIKGAIDPRNTPGSRQAHSMAFDGGNRLLYVYGGIQESSK